MTSSELAAETDEPGASGPAVLRHLLATLAYRAAKVVGDAPSGFGGFSVAETTRSPVAILAHMADLMDFSLKLTEGRHEWAACGTDGWEAEVVRFFARLEALDRALQHPLPSSVTDRLVQGPLADALTHVGQLALLRRLAGAPVRPESYVRAPITAGRVGLEQLPPGREFEGDASQSR